MTKGSAYRKQLFLFETNKPDRVLNYYNTGK